MVRFFANVFMIITFFSERLLYSFGQVESGAQKVNHLGIGGDMKSVILEEINKLFSKTIVFLKVGVTQQDNSVISEQTSGIVIKSLSLHRGNIKTNSQAFAESNAPIAMEKSGLSFLVYMESL